MKKIVILLFGVFMMTTNTEAKKVWKGSALLLVKEDKIHEFLIAVSKITKPTRLENGCLSYEGYQVLDANGKPTNKFKFHETWTSEESMMIDHKENAPHMKKFFEEIKASDPKETFLQSFKADGEYVIILE